MQESRAKCSSPASWMALQPPDRPDAQLRGNFVSEWFGHRIHPTVVTGPTSLTDQREERCPFLSVATREVRRCVKGPAARGICTISSSSNGPRQDWLVCPYRALDFSLFENAARRLFSPSPNAPLSIHPAPTLVSEDVRADIAATIRRDGTAVVFFQGKLGGEISLGPTERSPEVSFDTTLVEIMERDGALDIGRYGILEVQTMDFHGTYRHAVKNLTDALRLHDEQFHQALDQNQGRWISEDIEGPNIANVFKRTFYQMMLKFQIGAHESSAGCILALPAAVWDSWQRNLGRPELQPGAGGILVLRKPGALPSGHVPAWIYVFDIDARSTNTPNPLVITAIIATDADSIAHYAVKVAPEVALSEGGSAGMLSATIRRRLATWWPALNPGTIPGRRRRRGPVQ